ncbi:hypothetical protein ScPMuIL_014814 [Solemya velum]
MTEKKIKFEQGQSLVRHPRAVLDDKYDCPIQLEDVYVACIKNKKDASALIKELSSDFPLVNLLHLKRVRAQRGKEAHLQVIIYPKYQQAELGPAGLSLESLFGGKAEKYRGLYGPFVTKVPKFPALTRRQYTESLQFWTTAFHEDKRMERLLDNTFFSEDELRTMSKHMLEAIRCANKAKNKNENPIGAVIVDPASDQVVATSHDCRLGDNPLHHAAMVCIDMVARSQGGGMWSLEGDGMFYKKNIAPVEQGNGKKVGPYLCTGYDLYVTREPCAMCAMALVHARIQRVFYGTSYKEGALGSRYKIHVQRGLNHHYEAFQGLMEDESEQLLCRSDQAELDTDHG